MIIQKTPDIGEIEKIKNNNFLIYMIQYFFEKKVY